MEFTVTLTKPLNPKSQQALKTFLDRLDRSSAKLDQPVWANTRLFTIRPDSWDTWKYVDKGFVMEQTTGDPASSR